MRRRLSLTLALSATLALSLVGGAQAAECPGADLRPAADNIDQVAFATLCLINNERAAEGLPALKEQAQLTQASTDYSQLMVDQHFFAHVTPGGVALTARLQASGYLAQPGAWTIGENIAWGESFLASPTNIVKAWMDSPPHRANILSGDFDEIGLGIVSGVPTSSNAGATYTTDFGRRTPAAADDQIEEVVADDTSSEQSQPAAVPAAKRQSTRSRAHRAVRKAGKRTVRKAGKRTKRGRKALSMRAIRATAAA